MDETPVTRRACLTTLGVASGAALSGCSAFRGSDSDDPTQGVSAADSAADSVSSSDSAAAEPDQSSDVAFRSLSRDEPNFRDWIPETDGDRTVFDAAHNISHARENRAALPPRTYESVTQWTTFGGYLGMDFAEIDGMLVGLRLGVVYLGSFERSTVESRLAETQYQQVGTASDITYYAGFATHSSREQPNIVAVGDEGVIFGNADPDAETPGERFIRQTVPLFETARGNRPRLHEQSQVYKQYTDDIGWPLTAQALPPAPVDPDTPSASSRTVPGADELDEEILTQTSVGYAKHLGAEHLFDRWWLRPDPDGSVTAANVRDAFQGVELRAGLDSQGSLAVRQRDSVVDVALQYPIEEPGGGADPVIASVAVSVESGTAMLSHIGGDPVPLGRVTVVAGQEMVDPGEGTLSPGESVTVEVGSVDSVKAIYESPQGQATVIGSTR